MNALREELQSEKQSREEIQRARDGIVAKRLDLENELQVNFVNIMKKNYSYIIAITSSCEGIALYRQIELILLENNF